MKTIQATSIIKNKKEILDNNLSDLELKTRKLLIELLEEGIKSADPKKAVKKFLAYDKINNSIHFGKQLTIKLDNNSRIVVIGAGKATARMAEALEEILSTNIHQGIVCVPELEIGFSHNLQYINLVYAGHPIVNERSISGAKKILNAVKNLQPTDLVICLISGGGSALMELPIDGLNKEDLSLVFTNLTKAGATIHELNTVRKHLSQIKGGKLAKQAFPAKVVSIIISDVVGDNLDTIASGPTTPDITNWKDVQDIIEKYKLEREFPNEIKILIEKGLKGEIPETLKEDDLIFQNTWNFIIASNSISCEAMRKLAVFKGYNCNIISTTTTGQAKVIGKELAQAINNESSNSILIGGGETTVKIKGSGKGGRNQELVLAASSMLKEERGIAIASIGTDGKDGPTDAAGGFVDLSIIEIGKRKNLMIEDFLRNNDSYNFLKEVNGLIITGHTGTNVMDIFIAVKLNENS